MLLNSISILDNRQLNKGEIQLTYMYDRKQFISNSVNTNAKMYCDNYTIKNDRIYGFDINIEVICNNNTISNQIPIKELKFNGKIIVKY